MDCKRCLKNGIRNEGGVIGICYRHKKKKCVICGNCSDGNELCSSCQNEEELKRMEYDANNPAMGGSDIEVRKERLMQAKFFAHRAVEMYFRGLALSSEAMWGDISKLKRVA